MRRGGERRPLSSSGPEQSNDKERGSIFRVRADLRTKYETAFTPSRVSLGPLHYPEFSYLKTEKEKYLEVFIARAKLDSELARRTISSCLPKIKDYYEGQLNYGNDEFIQMMFVDGCFILECMRRVVQRDDSVVSTILSENDTWKDIILIENQVPTLVLEKIFDLTELCRTERTRTFLHLAMEFFSEYNPQRFEPKDVCVPIAHMVDLLRFLLLNPKFRDGSEERNIEVTGNVPSAKKLEVSGIDFKVCVDTENMMMITRDGFRIEMPELKMDGLTSKYLNNVLAYEEKCYRRAEYVHDYVYILTCLVKEKKDVEILREKGIILTVLADEKVLECFQNMDLEMNGIRAEYGLMLDFFKDHVKDYDNKYKANIRRICCVDLKRKILSTVLFGSFVGLFVYVQFFKGGGGSRLPVPGWKI